MNIQILDSWLREHIKTKATVKQIAEVMTLKSASVERVEKIGNDYLYDIEVTTNRVDMMSVVGLAREAVVALSSEGIEAKFIEKSIPAQKTDNSKFPVKITNNPKLCNRICAAILDVEINKSPQIIRDRLEASNIRSLNNVIDVTNYVMREIGHPMHAFDADKVGESLTIREAKAGETITTLDKKGYTLKGGEIVAVDQDGKIIDLLGIMGLANSSVTDNTKRILLFIDNNNSKKIRDASMNLGIRTDAAVLNEKDVDPQLGILALNRGVQLLEEVAHGKLVSVIYDEYVKKNTAKHVRVSLEKIRSVMGVAIEKHQVEKILSGLGFTVEVNKNEFTVTPPTYRAHEIEIPEDIIEEVARMYGYDKIPSKLPPIVDVKPNNFESNKFYFEQRVKNALKYWGFTEVYTYSLISEDLLEVAPDKAVTLSNPLSNDMVYLRTTIVPSLLFAMRENQTYPEIKLFELAHVYHKKSNDLPDEKLMLAGVIKHEKIDFYQVKGLIETLLLDLGIKQYEFKKSKEGTGAELYVDQKKAGEIEILDADVADFELNWDIVLQHASLKKTYKVPPKFPAAVEDLRLIISSEISFAKITEAIKNTSSIISKVELLDTYENKKTFRITYQSHEKNLASTDIKEIREKIIEALIKDLHAEQA